MKIKHLILATSIVVANLALLTIGLTMSQTDGAPAYQTYASGDFFFPPYPADSERMGIGGLGTSYKYDAALRPGWYLNWGAQYAPAHPSGAEYARTIHFDVNTNPCGLNKIPALERSQVKALISGTQLIENLQANPGALWTIGNEPDSIYNCRPIMPKLYAELYHEFYTFIKTYDPSARVAIGAIVQPSPLRLEYLDKVLDHYQEKYSTKLPTDLWNIHLYALPERAGGAGAGVPPDASATVGWTYNWAQTVDINLLGQNLRAMRQWMAERGEQNKPLIITEFGQLIPDDGSYTLDGLTFTQETSRDYLQGSITHFLTATDPLVGYPADGNRLVQMWAWYSLLDPYYGGDLIYSDGTLTPAGVAFAQITAQHFAPYADLYPIPLATPAMPPAHSTTPLSVSLSVIVDNHGNAQIGPVPLRFTQHDYVTGQLLASSTASASQVLTRHAGTQPTLSTQWLLTPSLLYTLTVEIDPAQTIGQARRSEQQLSYRVGWIPDLGIAAPASNPFSVFLWTEPSTATITVTLYNLGNLASSTSQVHFELHEPAGTLYLQSSVPAPALAPGDSINITTGLTLPAPGRYVIAATVIQDAGPDQHAHNNSTQLVLLAATTRVYVPLITCAASQANVTDTRQLDASTFKPAAIQLPARDTPQ